MKKLITCLIFLSFCKTVIPANHSIFCTSEIEAGISDIYSMAEYDLFEGKNVQNDIDPMDIFDIQFN